MARKKDKTLLIEAIKKSILEGTPALIEVTCLEEIQAIFPVKILEYKLTKKYLTLTLDNGGFLDIYNDIDKTWKEEDGLFVIEGRNTGIVIKL